jgi:hypothetical protein
VRENEKSVEAGTKSIQDDGKSSELSDLEEELAVENPCEKQTEQR